MSQLFLTACLDVMLQVPHTQCTCVTFTQLYNSLCAMISFLPPLTNPQSDSVPESVPALLFGWKQNTHPAHQLLSTCPERGGVMDLAAVVSREEVFCRVFSIAGACGDFQKKLCRNGFPDIYSCCVYPGPAGLPHTRLENSCYL